jgi:hypothetical protein
MVEQQADPIVVLADAVNQLAMRVEEIAISSVAHYSTRRR